jgi:hypothetical protein
MKKIIVLSLVLLSQALTLPAFARSTYICPNLDRDHISQLAISKSLIINQLKLKPLDEASIDIMKSATKNVSDRVDVTRENEHANVISACVYKLSVNGNHHGDASVLVGSDS